LESSREEPNRIILVNGNGSEWYEQAIFIVKKSLPAHRVPVDFVLEAEKVIHQYLAKRFRETDQRAAVDRDTLTANRLLVNQASMTNRLALHHAPAGRKKHSRSGSFYFSIALNGILLAGCLALLTALYLIK
jgi:hypothetical protein